MNIFESNNALVGARTTESAHRKVELQSPADLTYLIANVSRAAREKIDRHLPPDAAPDGEEDAMRKRVEALVDGYIRNVFAGAKSSMSVNGMEVGEMEEVMGRVREGEEIEPFDSKLAQRIQALSAQIENQTLQLANLRRNAPAETAAKFQQNFAQQTEEHDARLQKQQVANIAAAKAAKLDLGEMQRMDEVQETWTKGTEELGDLKTKLGGTVAKMERAQKAVHFVEGRE